MKNTPENITELKENEIFVFGSNTEGRHGKGLALIAKQKFGAIYGQSKGLQGNSYAIITKDLKKGNRSVSLDSILEQLIDLIIFATENTNLTFYVTKLGSSLAGFTIEEIKNLFQIINKKAFIPDNIILPIEYEVRKYLSTDILDLDNNLTPKAEKILLDTLITSSKKNPTKENRK